MKVTFFAISFCLSGLTGCTVSPTGAVTYSGPGGSSDLTSECTSVPGSIFGASAQEIQNCQTQKAEKSQALEQQEASIQRANAQQDQRQAVIDQENAQAAAQRVKEQQKLVDAAARNPSPALAEFETDMGSDYLMLSLGSLAMACNIRTDQWFAILNSAYEHDYALETQKIPLSDIERQTEQQKRYQQTLVNHQEMNCRAVEGGGLDQVDQIVTTWSGHLQSQNATATANLELMSR